MVVFLAVEDFLAVEAFLVVEALVVVVDFFAVVFLADEVPAYEPDTELKEPRTFASLATFDGNLLLSSVMTMTSCFNPA